MTLREILKKAEREAIVEALRKVAPGSNWGRGGRLAVVAEQLGISRKTLWEKCRALGIDKSVETPQEQLPFVPPPPPPPPFVGDVLGLAVSNVRDEQAA